jgi:16S rRNA (uracil1498-N3)-methyltransferase
MDLPVFFVDSLPSVHQLLVLDENTSRHVVQVLRMQPGELLQLTDGKGTLATASITDDHKKKCTVTLSQSAFVPRPERRTAIAISLLKNASRFEWFLEKATELGIQEIIPLLCERTEKQHFRLERMQSVLVSAMLQSRQAWLPVLGDPVKFSSNNFLKDDGFHPSQKFIAHCMENGEKQSLRQLVNTSRSGLVLIGPEGDFTPAEVSFALESQCIPVSLGHTRLRTETAGVVAATLLMQP